MTHLVVLDNEAVQALQSHADRKHRQVLSHLQVVAQRKIRGSGVQIMVPTSVRVEAGWNRMSADWAFPNMLRIADVPLDGDHANRAAAIRLRSGVSVADAHMGSVIQSASANRVTVITSDQPPGL
jgi:predicted nucleic acid-binding protein